MSSHLVVKKLLGGTLLALTLGLVGPALAAADAPDVTSAAGSIVSRDSTGTTVEIHGTWEWSTHRSDCNTNRAGAGFAIDWNDPNAPGNHVTVLNGESIDVGTPTDNRIYTEAGTTGPFTCGTFSSALGYNTGTFSGLTHKFAPGAIPQICALSYDVHGDNGIPNGVKETTAGGNNHNQDNSAEKNGGTPFGNRCFTVVLPNTPTVTTNAGPSTTVGSPMHDTATLSGATSNATGTITFRLYGPNDASCTGAPVSTSTATVNGNGNYVSADFTPSAAGTYRWIANYGGDAGNDATSNGCNGANENVVVGPAGPSVTTNAGPDVTLGSALRDTATLSGGVNPTGTITFRLYGPNDATCSGNPVSTSTATVTGNGNYTSGAFTPTAPGTYRWIANYGGDANNSATTNGCNGTNENVAVTGNAAIQIVKSGPGSALAGSDVSFTLEVTNPGNLSLSNVSVSDARCDATPPTLVSKHGDGSPLTLDPGDQWSYTCSSHTAVNEGTLHNVATTTGTPPSGPPVTDDDDADVPLRHPAINIDKTGPASVTAGTTIAYVLVVTNPGDQRFPAAQVVVTDPMCDAAPVLTSKNGDASPDFLNTGDAWNYACSHATTSSTRGTIHNVGNVTGTDEAGDVVTDSDDADTVVNAPPCTVNCGPPPPPPGPNPAITINKTGPATGIAGNPIPYNLDVANTGDQPFAEANLTLTDALCAATPVLASKNGDQTPAKLNPGETWTYTCTVPTALGQTFVHNVGNVTGVPDNGPPVSATDAADTTLTQPEQQVQPLLPGVSRLRGPTGCIASRTHVLRVTGSRIARVSFFLDGRYVGTRTKPNSGTAYTFTVRGAKLRRGAHRVVARVTYTAETNPATRTLTLAFARCARAVTPKFTG